MKFLFDIILEKAPWFIRWTFYLMIVMVTALGGAFSLGWQAAPYADAYVDHRIESWSAPRIALRNQQLKNIDDKLHTLSEDTRDIKNHLMGLNKKTGL